MDLGFTEEQEMLRKSTREFLAKECPRSYVRAMEEDPKGYSPEVWKKMAEMGWLGLVVPEQHGGSGASFLDLCILLEEMGRALLPGPFFSTVVLGALVIMDAGTDAQKKQFLPKVASGEMVLAFALNEPSASWEASGVELTAQARGDHYALNGTKLFIRDAKVADCLVVAARTKKTANPVEGITLFLVDPKSKGVSSELLLTIGSDKQCEVAFKDAQVPKGNVLGKVDEGWPVIERALLRAAAAKSVELVGSSQQVLEMTVDYAKQRVQFGRPIGSFQAIQHHCANMATDVDGSRYIAYQAAWALSEGMEARREVSMAKAWVSDASRRVAALGHQVHGGIGFTKEHDMQLFSRRAKAGELAFGDGDYHRKIVADLLKI